VDNYHVVNEKFARFAQNVNLTSQNNIVNVTVFGKHLVSVPVDEYRSATNPLVHVVGSYSRSRAFALYFYLMNKGIKVF
jgi:hypothetical protein